MCGLKTVIRAVIREETSVEYLKQPESHGRDGWVRITGLHQDNTNGGDEITRVATEKEIYNNMDVRM